MPIVAMNAGNSAGAKGHRFETVNRGNMSRHRADCAHDYKTYSLHTMVTRNPPATLYRADGVVVRPRGAADEL